MAVYAAHLTRTLQGTPSIFQVTAQEALGSTVKPALQKVVEVTLPTSRHSLKHFYLWLSYTFSSKFSRTQQAFKLLC